MRQSKSLTSPLTTFALSPLTAAVLLLVAVGVVLSLPAAAQGQHAVAVEAPYTFGDWASAQGYEPGDPLPQTVRCAYSSPSITDLDGIGDYDWNDTPSTFLILSFNNISTIESGAFSGLTNLAAMDMRNNDIGSIESGDFNGLPELTSLLLDNNSISSIESSAFSELTNLTVLRLGSNNFSSIEAGDFNGLANLTELWLHNNSISSIESGAFSRLTKMYHLSLNHNSISSLESNAFNGLANLGSLDLSYNQISSLESDDFSGLTNLVAINLSFNQISSLESDDFSRLTNLTSLTLNSNKLSSIESGAFSGLTNLTSLVLSNNQISNIESGAFSELPNLARLSLDGNFGLTQLNLEEADLSHLVYLSVSATSISSVSLRNAVLNQTSLEILFHPNYPSLAGLPGITEFDLSGVDFSQITDLSPIGVMDDITDLWMLDVANIDAVELDALLDELSAMEDPAAEGVLYLTQADYDALNADGGGLLAIWDAESGHHVQIVPEPATMTLLALGGLAILRKRRK